MRMLPVLEELEAIALAWRKGAAQRIFEAISKGQFDPARRSQFRETLRSAGRNATYPAIGGRLLEGADSMTLPR